uniref:Uncharacterized protein n=2 Tax=Noccaea caerulescens TaxID=107243 RepID=A0A1J3ICE2_NOCCA
MSSWVLSFFSLTQRLLLEIAVETRPFLLLSNTPFVAPCTTNHPPIIKRPNTHQTEIRIQIPCVTNHTGELTTTIIGNIEFLLIYHQIHENDATRVARRFNDFVTAVMVSTEHGRGTQMDMHFTVTDFNSQATNRLDVDLLIANLQTSNRVPTLDEQNEDCPICLQTF